MFLLVPAHPGFPGKIPQSRKTVVCVCDLGLSGSRDVINDVIIGSAIGLFLLVAN